MIKQATMEMWYGFRQRMKSWKGWLMLALMVFMIWMYSQTKNNTAAFFLMPYFLGIYIANLTGASMGKLRMILPMDAKEKKQLIYTKAIWVVLFDIIYFGWLFIHENIRLFRFVELLFLVLIPALLSSVLLYIRYTLPTRIDGSIKGYYFPIGYAIGGMMAVLCSLFIEMFDLIYVKWLLCMASYIFHFLAYKKLDKSISNENIYYDEIEEAAERVHW